MARVAEMVRGLFHHGREDRMSDEDIEAAMAPFALSVAAQNLRNAADAPRFKPSHDRILPRT